MLMEDVTPSWLCALPSRCKRARCAATLYAGGTDFFYTILIRLNKTEKEHRFREKFDQLPCGKRLPTPTPTLFIAPLPPPAI